MTAPMIAAIDFSDSSLEAARWAAQHLEPDAPLVLVHAVHIPAPPRFLRGMYPPLEPMIEDARRGAAVRLEEFAAGLGRGATVEIRVGRADDVLVELASELAPSLIVLGAHRERSGIWRALGSTVERVVRRVPSSLLLGRDLPAGALERVLVAVDDSDMAESLLAWAARFDAGEGDRVVLLHVIPGLLAGAVRMGARGREARRGEESLRTHAELWLRERAVAAGLHDAVQVVALGDVPVEILKTAKKQRADAIVVGAHGEGHGPFLGSAAEFVLRQGSGPVLVLRPASSVAGSSVEPPVPS